MKKNMVIKPCTLGSLIVIAYMMIMSINVYAGTEKYDGRIPFYDENEEIVAWYCSFEEKGYAIFKVDGTEFIGYSEKDVYKEVKENKHYYYSGPGALYEIADKNSGKNSGKKIRNIVSKETEDMSNVEFALDSSIKSESVDKNTESRIKKSIDDNIKYLKNHNSNEKIGNYLREDIQQEGVSIKKISTDNQIKDEKAKLATGTTTLSGYNTDISVVENNKLPRTTMSYCYNPDGRCGSVAAAIVFKYYYDVYNVKYIPAAYITTDGRKLINFLTQYYIPTSSSYRTLKEGMSKYLSARFSYTGSKVNVYSIIGVNSSSVYSKIKSYIDNKKPLIVGLTGHPTYREHWVVGTGYKKLRSKIGTSLKTVNSVVVNDGWGNKDITINMSYVDGCVYF